MGQMLKQAIEMLEKELLTIKRNRGAMLQYAELSLSLGSSSI